MKILKLNASHAKSVLAIYDNDQYMGVSIQDNFGNLNYKNYMFSIFRMTYLTGLNNFEAYGAFNDNDELECLISLYDSSDEPSWYYTLCRSRGNTQALKELFDEVLSIQESKNRFKFYTLVNEKHGKSLRKFTFSERNNERYGYFDEYIVPARTRCYYNNAWELLFKKVLLPVDSLVRCSYLKQEHRPTELPTGGGI